MNAHTSHRAVLAALLLFGGCANGAPSSEQSIESEAGATASGGESSSDPLDLLCGPRILEDCEDPDDVCRAEMDELLGPCVRTLASAGGLTDPTPEQRERLGGLAILCTLHVHRERHALAGRPCGGEEIEERYRSMCLLCSVEAGTVRVSED